MIALTFEQNLQFTFTIFLIGFMLFAGVVMFVNAVNLRELLRQGREDKEAREQAVRDLLVVTAQMERRAELLMQANVEISQKLDENTELTAQAAQAASEVREHTNGRYKDDVADATRDAADGKKRK